MLIIDPCLIALRATKIKLKAFVSQHLTKAFCILSNNGVTEVGQKAPFLVLFTLTESPHVPREIK